MTKDRKRFQNNVLISFSIKSHCGSSLSKSWRQTYPYPKIFMRSLDESKLPYFQKSGGYLPPPIPPRGSATALANNYYRLITSLKNLPPPAPRESLPHWFQGNFAAVFVLNYWLREFLLFALTNRFIMRCETKRLMLLYYKFALVVAFTIYDLAIWRRHFFKTISNIML